MKTNNEIIQEFCTERNLAPLTRKKYELNLNKYSQYHQQTLHELLLEADKEEEDRVRWKHRKIRNKLLTYRNHLLKDKKISTIKKIMTLIQTFYRHYDIEIHPLPPISMKQAKTSDPYTYKDLPTREEIRQLYLISNPVIKALTLFITSTGMSIRDTLNRTRTEYMEWIRPYTIDSLDECEETLIPTINYKRQKTGVYATTFTTHETLIQIRNYLLTRKDNNDRLFKISTGYVNKIYRDYNKILGYPDKNNTSHITPHRLRKWHASQLLQGENRLSIDEIDTLQGRTKKQTHKSYYFNDEQDLKNKYIRNLEHILIDTSLSEIRVNDPKVQQVIDENLRLKNEVDELKQLKYKQQELEVLVNELRVLSKSSPLDKLRKEEEK